MNTTHKGSENLIPLSQRTSEERREIARKGGQCSGVARRRLKTQREIVKYMGGRCPEIDTEKVRKQFGIEADIEITNDVAGIAKTYQKWISTGDPKYGEFLRDTKGEKPVETFEDLTPQSPIVLGTIPLDVVKQAKERKEARQNQKPEEVKK